MIDKTDKALEQNKHAEGTDREFSKGFIFSIVILTIAVFLIEICSDNFYKLLSLEEDTNFIISNVLIIPHWFALQIITMTNGVKLFAGSKPICNVYIDLWILFNILLFIFISPALVISGIKDYYNCKQEGQKNYTFSLYHIKIFTGAIFIFFLIVTIINSLIDIQENNEFIAKEYGGQHRQELSFELKTLSYEAAEYYILKSDINKRSSQHSSVLPALNKLSSFGKLKYGKYFIKASSNKDTLLCLTGIGKSWGNRDDFINADGSHGKIQYTAVIKPDATINILLNN